MKKPKRNINLLGVVIGLAIVTFSIWFGFSILTDSDRGTLGLSDAVLALLIGAFLIYASWRGKSTKHLLMKEDIGRFTSTPGWQLKDYLFAVFAIFGGFGIFVLLAWLFS